MNKEIIITKTYKICAYADLRWADLSGADLRWADLTVADLYEARIDKKWYDYIKNQNVINFDKIIWVG
jgi:uncharacterized protein YjbI with pentapeptide repeats